MTKYSVPSFDGHIDFSDEVTIYPFLVMSRTDNGRFSITFNFFCNITGRNYGYIKLNAVLK